MKKKLINISVFLLLTTLNYAINPLEGYVDKEKYFKGKNFQKRERSIFEEPLVFGGENSYENVIKVKFPKVISTIRMNGVWNGTFLFLKEEGTVRKTISGSGRIKDKKNTYSIVVFNGGIRIRDVVSGSTTEIKTKRR